MSDNVEYTSIVELSRRFRLAAAVAPQKANDFLVKHVAEPMVEEMRKTAPVDSGQLRDSIRYTNPSHLKIIIGSFGASHAKFVSEGTEPHEIRAVEADALAFHVGDQLIFRQSVQHPGTSENRFLNEARDRILARARLRIAGVMMGEFRERN